MDINTKKVRKNAFRVTKVRGVAASRVRVPGGVIDATTLGIVKDIAEKYGDGQIFITNRQGFELSGIPYDKMPEVNRALQPVIDRLGINQSEPGVGYDSSGTRNIIACIGKSS